MRTNLALQDLRQDSRSATSVNAQNFVCNRLASDRLASKRIVNITRNAALLIALSALGACATSTSRHMKNSSVAHINNKTKFSVKAYGVKGSPRVTTSKKVRKGGGRYQVGKPYKVKGKWYRPKDDPGYNRVGMASWYGPNFHGRLTANGEVYDQYALSAAHPTLPLPSYARVTNLENGSSVVVRINDRGPFSSKRIIDLSAQASKLLGYQKKGLAKVRVKYLGKARMDGRDGKYLMASYKPGRGQRRSPSFPTYAPGATKPGTLLASILPKPGRKQQTIGAPVLPAVSLATSTAYSDQQRSVTAVAFDNQVFQNPVFEGAMIPVPQERPTPLYSGINLEFAVNMPTEKPYLEPISFANAQHYNSRIARAFAVLETQFPRTSKTGR